MGKRNPKRDSGILLHITSLPGLYGIGDIGNNAKLFIDDMVRMGQTHWQILPTNHTTSYNSPYDTNSAFAQNPMLISLDMLIDDGLITMSDINPIPSFKSARVEFKKVSDWKMPILVKAANRFLTRLDYDEKKIFDSFCKENDFWLKDYVLFLTLKDNYEGKLWCNWNFKYGNQDRDTLRQVINEKKTQMDELRVLQYLFFKQWKKLKKYANNNGVKIIGDIPIYVSYDSSDVWSNQHLFKLKGNGKMKFQSGCPPDFWSSTGQMWGHPIYDWDEHHRTDYKWWTNRINHLMKYVDVIRIDHFNGLAKYWEIPAKDKNGLNGKWVNAKGKELLKHVYETIDKVSFIAEDLGEAASDAAKLRLPYLIPGMHVLQLSFHDNNPFDNMEENTVVYTGTHDNDTLLGYIQPLLKEDLKEDKMNEGKIIKKIISDNSKDLNWTMIEYCLRSGGNLAIIPLQDLLGLDNSGRMNTPGTISNENWSWRFDSFELTNDIIRKMRSITSRTKRI